MKFIPCEKCKNNNPPGFIPIGGVGTQKIVPCTCYREYEKDLLTFILLRDNGVLANEEEYDFIKKYTLNDYKGEKSKRFVASLFSYVKAIDHIKHNFFYFYGKTRTQKTVVVKKFLYLLAKENIYNKRFFVKYTTYSDLLEVLLDRDNKNYQGILAPYYEADVLVVDDAFNENRATIFKTGFQNSFVTDFFRTRLDRYKKLTIVITQASLANLSPVVISEDLRAYLMSLQLMQKAEIHFEDDYLQEVNAVDTLSLFNTIIR
jgi:hypothetical protein